MKMFKILPLLMSLSLLLSCATETGNPSANSNPAELTTLETLRNTACEKLVQCYASLDADDCIAGVNATTNIDTELGLTIGQYFNYQAAINGEISGAIGSTGAAATQCDSDLSALVCGSAEVLNAYSAGAPADFSNVFELFPSGAGSCTQAIITN